MPARTNTISRLPFLAPKKQRPSLIEPLQAPTHIAGAFRHYIENKIPTRLIDTTRLVFVERSAVFDVFSSEIAQVTEDHIKERMPTQEFYTHPDAGIYVQPMKAALQETIRDVVQYAIFSHRWTDSEPSYQDLSALASAGGLGKQRTKTTGLAKLVQLCEMARKLGYRLAWSDTCCIDKNNPNELSEAIHAMFRWYAYAHVCIVYLGASLSLADFERDPWFKRGWTLQELLAPRRIKFYNQKWCPFTNLINDKNHSALMSTLSCVTGIPWDVIVADNSHGIKHRGVWEIMSWASSRETTRIEDAAYCLYGLFDVNIPITYGEGEKAFPRLIEEIITRYREWDVFAWAGQGSRSHSVLPSSPVCYPKWDESMMNGGSGMTDFVLTPHGLRLMTVPLIPMVFASQVEERNGSYTVTLKPSDSARTLGVYGDVHVVCGARRLQHLLRAEDLHACILNYQPSRLHQRDRGELQAGRTYICFLLHMENRSVEGPTWLKFATENVLRVTCRRGPVDKLHSKGRPKAEEGTFDLMLRSTYIRVPLNRARSTFWAAPFSVT